MLKRISEFLYRISSGRVALAASILFVGFTATALPAQARQAEVYSNGAGSPDTSLSYSTKDLYDMAKGYEADGRAEYIHARFTFDLVFPLTYLFFLGTALSWSLSVLVPVTSRLRLLNLFPVFGWVFDMLENISVSIAFGRYPQATPVIDLLAPLFTSVKWIFIYGSFLLLIPGLLAALWRIFRR